MAFSIGVRNRARETITTEAQVLKPAPMANISRNRTVNLIVRDFEGREAGVEAEIVRKSAAEGICEEQDVEKIFQIDNTGWQWSCQFIRVERKNLQIQELRYAVGDEACEAIRAPIELLQRRQVPDTGRDFTGQFIHIEMQVNQSAEPHELRRDGTG